MTVKSANHPYNRNQNTRTNEIKELLIKKAIRKAEDDLNRRKQTEFLLWSHRKFDRQATAIVLLLVVQSAYKLFK